MYVLRRHSRRLLLPPGWVALGFLLLLGCQALLTHERQFRLTNIMYMTLPPLKQDTTWSKGGGKDYRMPYLSLSELDTIRYWYTIDYSGAELTDFTNDSLIKSAVRVMNADTNYVRGVRIRFHQHATYANLIEALDVMSICNQRWYFLDVRYSCATLYAVMLRPLPLDSSEVIIPIHKRLIL